MKKTAIAIAVAGVMAAPLAQADVTIKGLISPSIDFVDMDGFNGSGQIGAGTGAITAGGFSGTYSDYDSTEMNDNNSSIGFKWSEDLGNGNKVVGFVDFSYDPSRPGGSGEVDSRDQYVGFAGNWGKIVFGSTSTSYKSSGGAIDPLWRTGAQARGAANQISSLHSGSGDIRGRQDNMIRYDSPNMNGFKAIGWMSINDGDEDDHAWGGGLHYNNGPLFAAIDYLQDDALSSDDDAFKLSAKYTFGNFAIWGAYEMDGGAVSAAELNESFGSGTMQGLQAGTNSGLTTFMTFICGATATSCSMSADDGDMFYIAGSATFGNNFLQLAYGERDDADIAFNGVGVTGMDTGSESWSIVAGHNFSKRTTAYIGYIAAEYGSSAPEVLSQTGAFTSSFASGLPQLESATGDVDADVLTIGVRHKF